MSAALHLAASATADAITTRFRAGAFSPDAPKYRFPAQRDTYTSVTSAGTSISGPTTPASAWPELMPNVPIATAIASSKLLPAAVKARVAVFGYVRPCVRPQAKAAVHITAK